MQSTIYIDYYGAARGKPQMTDHVANEIIGLIVEETDADPTTLPPLQETVDVDALESLVRTVDLIQLTYYKYRIEIRGINDITIQEMERDGSETKNGEMS